MFKLLSVVLLFADCLFVLMAEPALCRNDFHIHCFSTCWLNKTTKALKFECLHSTEGKKLMESHKFWNQKCNQSCLGLNECFVNSDTCHSLEWYLFVYLLEILKINGRWTWIHLRKGMTRDQEAGKSLNVVLEKAVDLSYSELVIGWFIFIYKPLVFLTQVRHLEIVPSKGMGRESS